MVFQFLHFLFVLVVTVKLNNPHKGTETVDN